MHILEAHNLHVTFRKKNEEIKALDGIDFILESGKTTAVAGESGCGKTTLARALAGLLKPAQGETLFAGHAIFDKSNRHLFRRNVQMVFQNPYLSFDPRYTIFETLYETLSVFNTVGIKQAWVTVASLFFHVGLEPQIMLRYPHQVSGGQLQRAAIARSLINKPQAIIFDEPTAGLDITTAAQVIGLLQRLQQQHGLTFLFISHNLRLLKKIAHVCYILYRGKIMEYGPRDAVYDNPGHPYTQLLLNAAYQKVQSASEENVDAVCPFYARCLRGTQECRLGVARHEISPGHVVFCNHLT